MKFLILLVIVLAVVVWLQRLKKSFMSRAASFPDREDAGRNPFARRQRKERAEVMVQCTHCGMHFPASEAIANASGAVFCSEDHLRLASS